MEFVTNNLKALVGILGTAIIAGWVAFSVSAPRNADNYMNQEMEALGGKSINATMAEAKAEADAMQCAQYRELAEAEWERSIDNGPSDQMDHLDRQIERFCN